MSKFKVGDKIRYLGTKEGRTDDRWEEYFGSYGVKKGSVGIIKSCSSNYMFVKDNIRNTTCGCLIPEDLELVETAKFKEGDKVRCINDRFMCITKDKTYIVEEVAPNGSIRIIVDDGKVVSGYGKKYFELVTPKDKLIKTDMDIEDIKNFPKAVLVNAEKEAKKQLAKEQSDIAVTKFKELLGQIDVAERDVKKANKRLTELRGMAKITKK